MSPAAQIEAGISFRATQMSGVRGLLPLDECAMKTNIGYGNRPIEALCVHRTFFRLIMKLQPRQVCETVFIFLYTALKQINNEDYVM